MQKGVSILDDNFVYNEKIESQEIIKDILDLKFESFLEQTMYLSLSPSQTAIKSFI